MKGGKQVGVVCYICGREFGTRSIAIHEPQCIKKWDAANQKMPKGKRQPRPTKPVEFDQSFSNDPKEREKQIAAINEASNAAATANLAPCSNCGRKFTQARIETHESVCTKLKMSPGKALKSGSGFYGQRVVVVDGEQVEVIRTKEKTFVENPMQTNILSKVEEQISQNVKRGPLKMLPCPFCKRAFSTNAISIHTKNCKEKPAAAAPPPPPQTQQAPQAATEKSIRCPFCNKGFPHNMITVHTKNCSSKPKELSPQPPPPRQQQNYRPQVRQPIQNGTKVLQQGNDFSAPHVPHPPQAQRKVQAPYATQPEYEETPDWNSCNEEEPQLPTRANTQPNIREPQPITRTSTQPNIQRNPQPSMQEPQRRLSTGERKKWDAPKVPQLPDAGYNRYSSSLTPRDLSPRDRINSSLNTDALGRGNEEVVDLVLGVNPNLVLTCMVCGLIVLKSQLNTHYHNYCDSSSMQRSATMPDKTVRLSKSSSRSKIPQMSNRSSVTKLPDALPSQQVPPSDSPEMLKCQSCNEEFGHDEIIEHEEECFKSAASLSYTTNTFNRPSSPSSNVVGKVVTGRFVTCINCGKAFTVRSLVIHQKTCLNK